LKSLILSTAGLNDAIGVTLNGLGVWRARLRSGVRCARQCSAMVTSGWLQIRDAPLDLRRGCNGEAAGIVKWLQL